MEEGSDHDMHAARKVVIHELAMNGEGLVSEIGDISTMGADDLSQGMNETAASADVVSDSDGTSLYYAEGVPTRYRHSTRNNLGVPFTT
jgi:hypothetical protein